MDEIGKKSGIVRNAKIESTFLGLEGHGIFSFSIGLDYGDLNQSAGGFALDFWDKDLKRHVGAEWNIPFLRRILRICGVERWEDLPGQMIRVKATHTGVQAIGHIIKEDWLEFGEFIRAYQGRGKASKKVERQEDKQDKIL